MYNAVPHFELTYVREFPNAVDSPKSAKRRWSIDPSFKNKMLSGLMSLWIIPLLWMWETAFISWVIIFLASFSSRGFPSLHKKSMIEPRFPPFIHSVTIKIRVSLSFKPTNLMTLSWLKVVRISGSLFIDSMSSVVHRDLEMT